MCGRFTSILSPELLAAIFEVQAPPNMEARYNIAPTQLAPIIRDSSSGRFISAARWGLVPSWSRDLKSGSHMINARCETVQEKPAFRHSIKYRRCIVPASGYYEWEDSGGRKQPYYIQLKDESPMGLAALWEQWKAPDGEVIETFCILTTAAGGFLMRIHDRMPLILHPDCYGLWLEKNMHDPEQLQHLYHDYPAELMTAYMVADLVNNPRFDGPACIERL